MPTRCPVAFFIVLALTAGGSTRRVAAEGFVLIRNAQASTATLSSAEVKALYTGKAKTFAGDAAVVVIRPEGDEPFRKFASQVFGVSAKTLLSKIKQEVFKGEMTKPLKAGSDDDVVRYVGASLGTIGVVSTSGASHLPSTVAVLVIGG
jgi:ABC-type phosphate transport system substrate-binding protein